jgi:cobalt-zinc-cadmium efflux system membrane fusion protein
VLACAVVLSACSASGHTDAAAGAPPAAPVDHEGDGSLLHVDHPEQFPLVTATLRDVVSELSVTGAVSPDVSRAVPVVSLASGRVVDLRVRLGDSVKEGQLLLRIQSTDIASAFSDYRKAQADETLARAQLDRTRLLFERGAAAKKDLEVAQDTADKATVDVETAAEHLHLLGVDPKNPPTGIVDILAPVSGVITEQNVTNAAGVRTLDNSPNLFTISDLSHVWIVCDVYERDLAAVRVGDTADIHVTAYPDHAMTGRIDNIGPVLDPNLRTAKVRIQVANPGILRVGMFVTATFHGQTKEPRAVVPASAVLHLHDKDWVYEPGLPGITGAAEFERKEVVGGQMLPGNLQELRSGLSPGTRVVLNALVFQNTVEQ